jgi:hypothetical protein
MLYQFCHTGGTDAASVTTNQDSSWKTYWVAANVVLGAAVVLTAVVCFVLPAVKKKETPEA